MKARGFLTRSHVWLLLRIALAAVFLYAGITKVLEPAPLVASIVRFQLVPLPFVHALALGLPLVEVVCGVALLAGPWKRQAAFGIIALMLIFLGALISAAARGLDVNCACFGSASSEPMWWLIVRDLLLLACAVAVYPQRLLKDRALSGVLNSAATCRHSAASTISAHCDPQPRSSS